ncbi:MAG: 30S ribosomal protein S20, partial [Pseudomonadota bacterium]|nr:30S ribosomal protein S20 [Pseudomonadota bacterium]
MANHKSAEKRIRQTTTRTAANRARMSPIKASLKKV